MNKKGSILTGLMVFIVGVTASIGTLFSGGPGNTAGSGMLLSVTALTAYSQMPHVVKDFRQKKAIGMCEETDAVDCEEMVASWSDEDVLDYIRDDELAVVRTNGGNFIGGNMNE